MTYCVLDACMSMHCVCAVPRLLKKKCEKKKKTRTDVTDAWWATVWVLGIKPGYCQAVVSAFNLLSISHF